MNETSDFSFPSAHRLRNRIEFQKVREKGNKFHSPHFLVQILLKTSGPTRLGITASRKVGGAVARNRIKRVLREIFRLHYHELTGAADFSIVAKRGAEELPYMEAWQELEGVFRKISAFRS